MKRPPKRSKPAAPPRRAIVEIHDDFDVEDPTASDGFKIYSFSTRHRNFKPPREFHDEHGHVALGLRNKLRAGTAFWLGYFEHGRCAWFLEKERPLGTEGDFRWDGVARAGLLVWEEDPAGLGSEHTFEGRRDQARQFLETYTSWVNGDCYGYLIKDAGTGRRVDACWGFIGWESVKEEAQQQLQSLGYQADLARGHHKHVPSQDFWTTET